MQILIIGGTRFQGKYLIGELLKNNHHVTVFHRGMHALDSHPQITEILGDRNSIDDLKKIPHENYDWLIDTCAYFPLQCKQVLNIFGKNIKKICFVSSAYVYKDFSPNINEDDTLKPPVVTQKFTPENYGSLKVMCEEVYSKHGLENTLILRPSIIIGNGDHTGRLAFWLMLSRKFNSLIKLEESTNKKVSVIGVRDLATFTYQSLNDGLTGVFNLNGHCVSLNEMLAIFHKQAPNNENTTFKVTEKKLETLGIKKSALPFLENDQSEEFDSQKAQDSGLKIRGLESTLLDFSDQAMPLDLPEAYVSLIKDIL
jgi:2'-hydroxyisoflavone reductase